MAEIQKKLLLKEKRQTGEKNEYKSGVTSSQDNWRKQDAPNSNIKDVKQKIISADHNSGKDGISTQTLRAMEAKRIRNLEALKVKYQPANRKISGENKISFGNISPGPQEDESSDQENYDDMIKDYYDQKGKGRPEGSQIRLLSSNYKRAESSYSQGLKFGQKQSSSKEKIPSHLRYSYNPEIVPNAVEQLGLFKERFTHDHDRHLLKVHSKEEIPFIRNIQGSAKKFSVEKKGPAIVTSSRSSSKYSLQNHLVSGYGQKFGNQGNSSSELYRRYLEQLKKASELREKGHQIKKNLKDRQSRIIEAILVDNQINRPIIRLNLNEQDGLAKKKKNTDLLDFAKRQGKPISRLEDWSSHVSSNMLRNSEESQYVFSNIKKLDQDAEQMDRVLSNMKRPNKPYFPSKQKEDKYMEAIRAKFGFLEGI